MLNKCHLDLVHSYGVGHWIKNQQMLEGFKGGISHSCYPGYSLFYFEDRLSRFSTAENPWWVGWYLGRIYLKLTEARDGP